MTARPGSLFTGYPFGNFPNTMLLSVVSGLACYFGSSASAFMSTYLGCFAG
jgi:hypothetical protein